MKLTQIGRQKMKPNNFSAILDDKVTGNSFKVCIFSVSYIGKEINKGLLVCVLYKKFDSLSKIYVARS